MKSLLKLYINQLKFLVCFDLTHLPMEEFLCCVIVVEMVEIEPNRSSDEIDILTKKKHLIGQTYLVAFLSHIDATETT